MNDQTDHWLDVKVGDDGDARSHSRWLGIHFECCNAYARIHRNKAGTAYVGWCPQCGKQVRLRIGTGGTSARFFSAS